MKAPRHVVDNPSPRRWLAFHPDGTVTVRTGKVELGQGILTAIQIIAAAELDVAPSAVRIAAADTAMGPDEGPTAGSMSVADAGSAVRFVCAAVRARFVAVAAGELSVAPAAVTVTDATFAAPGVGRHLTYAELADRVDLDGLLDTNAELATRATAAAGPADVAPARLDLPDKVTGRPRYLTDLRPVGLLWGRVVRPPSPAAVLERVDPVEVEAMHGVLTVVRDGSFLGLVAADERVADVAAERLGGLAVWRETATLPDEDDLSRYLRGGPSTTFVVDETGEPVAAVERRLSATYSRPFLAHASMAPSCGVAQWSPDGELHVWSHSQNIFGLRAAVAQALDVDPQKLSVEHVEHAGAYGHNGADDAAFDAALLAREVPGRPVQVRWSRSDELSWAPFGSAQLVDLSAGLDADGRVVSWEADIWSQGHTSRPGYAGSPGLLAAAHLEGGDPLPPPVDPPPERGAGSARGAVPDYALPARRIRGHRLDEVALRTSSLRSLGAFTNAFAIECFMDELAEAVGADPVEFRLAHLDDERGRTVLTALADRSGWAGRPRDGDVGWGIGLAQYKKGGWCGVVAEVEAVADVRLRRLVLVAEVGRVVHLDGVRNQVEGGAVQSASWTLKERVRFDTCRVTSVDWETYPILRFSEVPPLEVHVLDRPDLPSVGAGEIAQGPTAAAIANGLAAAVGVRVRDLPLTAEAVVRALEG
jgi:nicotinate dehydrogenase subunit B